MSHSFQRNFILCPLGSSGDVFPFIGLGRALLQRGHQVTVVSLDTFAEAITTAGLRFASFGSEADFDHLVADARLWNPLRGPAKVFHAFVDAVPRYLEALRRCMLGDLPVTLISSGGVFAARIIREQTGVPHFIVHLQPAVFLSAYETPVYLQGTAWLAQHCPVWIKKIMLCLPNPIDLLIGSRIRSLCKAEGITPPRSVWHDWWHSPDGTVALFPEWFAEPQPDWPQPLYQHTFPLEDLGADQSLSAELKTFLAQGSKPVVFTLGTGNQHARLFFEIAAKAVAALGIRAIFATRYPEHCLPTALPKEVLAVKYAPFSLLLPHCAALVSHGGVGTCSQAMSAGVPHLVIALAHDQPDNAYRLQCLGVGEGIAPRQLSVRRLILWLSKTQTNSSLTAKLSQVRELLLQRPSVTKLIDWLEQRSKLCQNDEFRKEHFLNA
jgi:rhamnosyltransferase subunit B